MVDVSGNTLEVAAKNQNRFNSKEFAGCTVTMEKEKVIKLEGFCMKEKQETVERIREIRQQLDEGKADKVM